MGEIKQHRAVQLSHTGACALDEMDVSYDFTEKKKTGNSMKSQIFNITLTEKYNDLDRPSAEAGYKRAEESKEP